MSKLKNNIDYYDYDDSYNFEHKLNEAIENVVIMVCNLAATKNKDFRAIYEDKSYKGGWYKFLSSTDILNKLSIIFNKDEAIKLVILEIDLFMKQDKFLDENGFYKGQPREMFK